MSDSERRPLLPSPSNDSPRVPIETFPNTGSSFLDACEISMYRGLGRLGLFCVSGLAVSEQWILSFLAWMLRSRRGPDY